MRRILIVDDIMVNREILKKIFGAEYEMIEARDGEQALALMEQNADTLSAVVLDLQMPVMDGYEVLRRRADNAALSALPVIIVTGTNDEASRVEALGLGANDFIAKPYNADIIRHCVKNNIIQHETASLVNRLQRDKLTGLYGREAFFEKVAEMVRKAAPDSYVMTCFDIDHFKLINDRFGVAEGDRVLKYIGTWIEKTFSEVGGISGRITGDNFVALFPNTEDATASVTDARENHFSPPDIGEKLSYSVGRYVISDPQLPVSAMYDRAYLAKQSVKGMYDRNMAIFDDSMLQRLIEEQWISSEMDEALEKEQFEVWFQPQMNHVTGALIGAEALVRWRHPERGLISPGVFIPIFEQNGFIYELDKFVWGEVCRNLRRWTDEGRNPLPISVNVSRYDIFKPDLIDTINGLISRYNLPESFLRLEVTESAFASSEKQVIEVVKRLIACGYTIEIDDFGSGYSSLNTLKNVPADILKLDMKFFENDGGTGRGGNIVESVVRMAKWLGMSVLAEGVEEAEQADFLKSVGCSYIQGYLYAKPMPLSDYEAYARGIGKEEKMLTLETVENLDNNAFWDPKSMDSLIFNSYIGGACIFEYHDGRIEVIRSTDKFAKVFGSESMTVEDVLKLDWSKHFTPDSFRDLILFIKKSYETKQEYLVEPVITDIPGCPSEVYLRSTVRVIAGAGNRYLVYSTSQNITEQRVAEHRVATTAAQMQAIMNNVGSGITAVFLTDPPTILFANDKYFDMFGYTRAQFDKEIPDAYFLILPEDCGQVREAVVEATKTGESIFVEFRAKRRDGTVIWVNVKVSTTYFPGMTRPVNLAIYTDITELKYAEEEQRTLLDNLPCGAALFTYDGAILHTVHLNKRLRQLAGLNTSMDEDKAVAIAVHPDDLPLMLLELEAALRQGRDGACDIRIRDDSGIYHPFHAAASIMPHTDGTADVCATYTPISDEAMTIQEMLPVALNAMMAVAPDYTYVKDCDLRYVSASRSFALLLGYENERDILGKTDYDLFNKDFADIYSDNDRAILQSGEALIDCVETCPVNNGTARFITTSKYLLRDALGKIIGIFGSSRDITAELENESRLKLLTDTIPGGIAIYEGRLEKLGEIRLTYFSDGYCRLFGFTREEYEKQNAGNAFSLIFPEDLPRMTEHIKQLVSEHIPLDFVYRAYTRDGGYKWINVKGVMGENNGDNMTVNAVLIDVTQRQESLERLRVSEEANRLAMQQVGKKTCRYDVKTQTLSLPETNPIFGLKTTEEHVPYAVVRRGDISNDTANAYIAFYESIINGEKAGQIVYQRRSKDGWRWIRSNFTTIFSSSGEPVSAVISYGDVTDEMNKEAVFKKWQQSLHDRTEDSYTLFRCNLSRDSSYDSAEGTLVKTDFDDNTNTFDERTAYFARQHVFEPDVARYTAFLKSDTLLAGYYRGKRTAILEFRDKQENGGYRWLKLTVDLVEYPNSTDVEIYMMYENIDADKRMELETIERSKTDPLTGVLNRAAFSEQMNEMIRVSGKDTKHALLMLDIDCFKMVNDAFGHDIGDQALTDISHRLQSVARAGDLVGRLGGDEFVLFIRDIPNDSVAASKAQEICMTTRRSFSAEVMISASVGIAISPRDGGDFSSLYKKADAALYHVKGSGKSSYTFYRDEIKDENLQLEQPITDSSAPATDLMKRRMLIVDDNQIDFELMKSVFEDDFVVDRAANGEAALIRLRHYGSAISVVLLDLCMPGIDGFGVLKQMRESGEMNSIPVVVVSGDDHAQTSLTAIRSGASDFVIKPIDPDLLRVRVFSAVSKAENAHLRVQNHYLQMQNDEIERYRMVLSHTGIAVIECDWIRGTFLYDPNVSAHLAGIYDGRKLWRIFLSDMVADTATVHKMQSTMQRMAEDRYCQEKVLVVQLKTPSRVKHWFRISIYKKQNEFRLTEKLILTFRDLGAEYSIGEDL